MRDLFQVVFELKKKEIEMARQQIQSKIIHEHQPITLNVKSTGTDPLNSGYNKSSSETTKANAKEVIFKCLNRIGKILDDVLCKVYK